MEFITFLRIKFSNNHIMEKTGRNLGRQVRNYIINSIATTVLEFLSFLCITLQVRDLLNPSTLKVKGGMKVRQNPKTGFYGMQNIYFLLALYHNLYLGISIKPVCNKTSKLFIIFIIVHVAIWLFDKQNRHTNIFVICKIKVFQSKKTLAF